MQEEFACIGLTNPKSASNLGSVLRAAGCFGADEVWYHGNRIEYAKKYATDTQLAAERVALVKVESFIEQKPIDVKLVCVELTVGATPLAEFTHPEKALYVFGPEDGSISQEVVSKADAVVYIPTHDCLNLAATANIVLYDRATKRNLVSRSDEQIIDSRDRNNVTKI
ncbi:RNA methyltransferase [Reinekea marinisedimentorum]|nr:RNA methyltransferase [Reinekea marinisedimentorum]